ncbi:MAG: paraquat-inducible protein A [Planktomarina sp.]
MAGYDHRINLTWTVFVFATILALVVTFLAVFAPFLKVIGMALIQFKLADHRIAPALGIFGKLAMADIFLIALYIVVIKGIGIGKVEVAWGLYLFTFCILLSICIQILEQRKT